MRARSDRRRRPRQLEAREEERDLRARRRRRIGAMHRVLLDVGAELAADRPPGGLLRVGGAHEIAPARDRAFPFQHADEDRPRAHEADQVGEEGALPVDGVEALGVGGRQAHDAAGDGHEAALLDHGEDAAEDALAHGVGLHDAEGALGHLFPFRTACIAAPSSAGLGASVTPARRKASIFSAAVPFPPAMIAPAWPMRLPLGAVWPATKASTGLVMCSAMKAAASSSAVPLISPISMTASVPASSWKRRSASTKPVPMIGSPPIPMQVDCPMPRSVSWCTAS